MTRKQLVSKWYDEFVTQYPDLDWRERALLLSDLDAEIAFDGTPTLQQRWRLRIRSRLRNAIIVGRDRPSTVVPEAGCTAGEVVSHIESLWTVGMNWDTWSFRGWHIDHIRPLSSFNLTKKKQRIEASHYSNLQPLWALDNLRKSGAKADFSAERNFNTRYHCKRQGGILTFVPRRIDDAELAKTPTLQRLTDQDISNIAASFGVSFRQAKSLLNAAFA